MSTSALLLVVCLASIATAQEPGAIAGRILDQTGGVLHGVTIELTTGDGLPHAAVSDATGRYHFDGVASGSAALRFRLINFAVLRRTVTIYTSRLPGEPAPGVDDVHTHPALPRSARVGLHVSF